MTLYLLLWISTLMYLALAILARRFLTFAEGTFDQFMNRCAAAETLLRCPKYSK